MKLLIRRRSSRCGVLVIVDVWCATTLGDLSIERGERGVRGVGL